MPAKTPEAEGRPGEDRVRRFQPQMVMLFDSVGYKTLSIELVAERRLLEPA